MKDWIIKDFETVQLEEGKSQYDGIDFSDGKPVKAIYRKCPQLEYRDNPFIAALPPPMSDERVNELFHDDLYTYTPDEMKRSDYERMQLILRLQHYRVKLPFVKQLAFQVNADLVNAYNSKRIFPCDYNKTTLSLSGEIIHPPYKLVGQPASATAGNGSILGTAGCGKTAAIEKLTHYYPPVIEHETKYGIITQIPIIVTGCIENSDLNGVYNGFGNSLDLLTLNDHVYEDALSKKMKLDPKAEEVRRYIESYNIGMWVLDEIQLMDFSANRKNSFDTLLNLKNRTKTAIVPIGTEEAKEKIFGTEQMGRRVDATIEADAYCQSKKLFAAIIKDIWHYQWFDEPVLLSEDIIEALCDCTKCIISHLISLLMYVYFDYLIHKTRPIVNGAYIHKVMDKYFSDMEELLERVGQTKADNERQKALKKTNEKLQDIINTQNQRIEMEKFQNRDQTDIDKARNLKASIIKIVSEAMDVQPDKVGAVYDDIYKATNPKDRNEKYLKKALISYFSNEQAHLLPKKRPISQEETKAIVFGNGYTTLDSLTGSQ